MEVPRSTIAVRSFQVINLQSLYVESVFRLLRGMAMGTLADRPDARQMRTMYPSMTATRAKFADMVAIARSDHWFKNIFMVPGLVIGLLFVPGVRQDLVLRF